MECTLCRRVATALSPDTGRGVSTCYNEKGNRIILLGSWRQLKHNQSCFNCLRIVRIFHPMVEKDTNQNNNTSEQNFQFSLCDHENRRFHLHLESLRFSVEGLRLPAGHGNFHHFEIQPLDAKSSDRPGVLLNKEWLDLDRVCGWLKTCNTTHNVCRKHKSKMNYGSGGSRMILISLIDQCLVDFTGSEEYAALSYVWGNDQQPFSTTRSNITNLRVKGSLATKSVQCQLPGTIRRAMQFTLLLNIQYLWVDRLCIIQDDPIHAMSQINCMGKVYFSSFLTLCAADGEDSSTGLRGIQRGSDPRYVRQDVFNFSAGEHDTNWVTTARSIPSVYHSRGWTFQELVLSGRQLSFTDQGLTWKCHTLQQEEKETTTKPVSIFETTNIVHGDTMWPCLRKWDDLFTKFLDRRLTFKGDILRAFSGVLEMLENSAIGNFHYGLPEHFFDAALLWVGDKHLTRRRTEHDKPENPAFPSWSRVGWEGATSSLFDDFGLCHERLESQGPVKPPERNIYPCVTWFKVNSDRTEMEEISNDYTKCQNRVLDDLTMLQQGWLSHEDDDTGFKYWTYRDAPSHYTFWYPIPVGATMRQSTGIQWSPLLYLETQRRYLTIGRFLTHKDLVSKPNKPSYSLVTEAGSFAGVLYTQSSYQIDAEKTQQAELLKISGGYVEESLLQEAFVPELRVQERLPSSSGTYHFFHVLWIKWYGNVAERQGIGRVEQSIWNSLPRDDVKVFLR